MFIFIINNLTQIVKKLAMDKMDEDAVIWKQSWKAIFSNKILFTLITLISILPLAIIDLPLSNYIFSRIENNLVPNSRNYFRESTPLEWFCYCLYRLLYIILLTIFSLITTATIVFTVASIYTSQDIVFKQAVKLVPKIWKKLFLTFLFIYSVIFVYNVIYRAILFIPKARFGYLTTGFDISIIIIIIIFLLGFSYLTVILELASVVTVLENIQGFKAIEKGNQLANGKRKVGMVIAFVLYLVLLILVAAYGNVFFKLRLIWRVIVGVSCGILIILFLLVFIVSQTVLYLVCKSYSGEAIDIDLLRRYMEERPRIIRNQGDGIQLLRYQAPAQQV